MSCPSLLLGLGSSAIGVNNNIEHSEIGTGDTSVYELYLRSIFSLPQRKGLQQELQYVKGIRCHLSSPCTGGREVLWTVMNPSPSTSGTSVALWQSGESRLVVNPPPVTCSLSVLQNPLSCGCPHTAPRNVTQKHPSAGAEREAGATQQQQLRAGLLLQQEQYVNTTILLLVPSEFGSSAG